MELRKNSGPHIEETLPLGLDWMYLVRGPAFIKEKKVQKLYILFLVLYDRTVQERALWFDFKKKQITCTVLNREVYEPDTTQALQYDIIIGGKL